MFGWRLSAVSAAISLPPVSTSIVGRHLMANSRVTLSGQLVSLEAGSDGQVGDDVAARAALHRQAGGLGADTGRRHDDARDFHQVADRLRLREAEGRAQ